MFLRDETLSKLKQEIFLNATRLYVDACHLYKKRSFPSAYVFSILSYEELGKLELVDHICDDICLNSDSDRKEFLKLLFSRDMFYSHKTKQTWAIREHFFIGTKKRRRKSISKGQLEKNKQDALYVGFKNHRIISPRQINSGKAWRELKECLEKFKEIGDLGFNGFLCISDTQTRNKARKNMRKLESMFLQLKK
jgi:AbiV family abortive infection protein